MVILGIDPGLATLGYGVISGEARDVVAIDYGVVLTPAGTPFPERLSMIERGLTKIIERYTPDEIAFEELFFNTNLTTGISVAHARGVALNTAYKYCKKLYEYTPLQIKQALTGYGRAEKRQIQLMVTKLLNLKKIPRPDDAADALAVALTHSSTSRFSSQFLIT